MKLTFESELQYQREAIKSIVDLLDGHPLHDTVTDFSISKEGQLFDIVCVSNKLALAEEEILKNLHRIQESNEIKLSSELDGLNFSVEMETGTGKTYVYLRTIYELNAKYGFKKFVIVVPSIAIREGVLKNLEITHEHFQNLYDKLYRQSLNKL